MHKINNARLCEDIQNPQIGMVYTPEQLIRACDFYHLHDSLKILTMDPPNGIFLFDGCSGPAPEDLCGEYDITLPCFIHDIEYYCGRPGEDERRAIVDHQFAIRILETGAPMPIAELFFNGVRVGGEYWPGAKWGWGRA